MSREKFNSLLEIIKSKLEQNYYGRKTITTEKQLLITIWTLVTPDSYR